MKNHLYKRSVSSSLMEDGFSLIELMISITIAMLLTIGIGYVIMNTSNSRKELDRMNRQIENGRFAMQIISDDLSHAGFFGRLYDTPAAPAALIDPCSTSTTDLTSAVALHIQGYDDSLSSFPSCISNHKAGTDVLVIRRASTIESNLASLDAKRIYIQAAALSYIVDIGTNSGSFTLTQKNHTDKINPRAFVTHIYWVNTSDQLMVAELDADSSAAKFTTLPIADGIEDIQFDYGIDNTGPDLDSSHAGADPDGSPDSYSMCSASGTCSIADWQNVTAIRISVLARNPEKTPGYSDSNKSYSMGLKGATSVSLPSGYRRHLYQGLARLNDIGGRREL